MTPRLKDVQSDENEWAISLTKLTGLKIKDVEGYLSGEMGGTCFKLTFLIFEDGSEMGIEGEHDFPYLTTFKKWPIPNMDDETLEALNEQEDEDDED